MEEKTVIVISDTHMGSVQFNHDELCEFLEWIPSLSKDPITIPCEVRDGEGNKGSTRVTLKVPEKLILLGDVLELWDPIGQNRDFSLIYAAKPFALLQKLPCRKVYVVGNHDEDLSDLHDTIDGRTDGGCKKLRLKESAESIFQNRLGLEIYNRHYPPKDKATGISHGEQIGRWSYFFLHGHQFDRWQVFRMISDAVRVRIDPIDYLQDLSNVSFTKEIYANLRAFALFMFAFVLSVYAYLAYKSLLFASVPVFALYLFLASFVVISSFPKLVMYVQRKAWCKAFKVEDKSAEEVVEKSFKARQDKINADVVVFGHTHLAGDSILREGWKLKGLRNIKRLFGLIKPGEEGRKKLFVNTGCWVGEDNKDDSEPPKDMPRKVNTFAYIDSSGIYLFKWNSGGKPNCIGGFTSALQGLNE